eukprot:scaffold70184_cov35-Tisochrysis_lutea.AAC.1
MLRAALTGGTGGYLEGEGWRARVGGRGLEGEGWTARVAGHGEQKHGRLPRPALARMQHEQITSRSSPRWR